MRIGALQPTPGYEPKFTTLSDVSQMEFSAFINASFWDSTDYMTTPLRLSIAISKAQFHLVVPFNYSEPPTKALNRLFCRRGCGQWRVQSS